ncbi:hemerythrin domain-containing protein [Microbacterium esteraromaticum]|uniref:Hemerythrin domain-containing protein n=1 Tax=Microbacterium esteraromaticum TaxID=57043 RepID=A0A7D7WGJ7_9MICO|nr:hemerythrin domain-containing protein [Microbacterium esteraromaticum]
MAEGETERIVAWSEELKAVHARLRQALALTRQALADGEPTRAASRDLLLFCHGFCAALSGHHLAEDRELFPAIVAEHPQLGETLRKLEQDHAMMSHLIAGLQTAVDSHAAPADLARHLEGLAAIMESHFRYEERQLLHVLDTLELDADSRQMLGPL